MLPNEDNLIIAAFSWWNFEFLVQKRLFFDGKQRGRWDFDLQVFELLLKNPLLSQSLCDALADRSTRPPGSKHVMTVMISMMVRIFIVNFKSWSCWNIDLKTPSAQKNEHEIWQRTQLTRQKSLWASLGQSQNGKDFLQRLVSAPSKGNTWKYHI